MFYRLPVLFSASYYFLVLLAHTTCIMLNSTVDNSEDFFYIISKTALNDLTSFFFILILSSLFFYQTKLYFYIPKNKKRVIILAIIFAIIYVVIDYILHQLVMRLFLPYFIDSQFVYTSYGSRNNYQTILPIFNIIAYVWTYVVAAIMLYFLIKLTKKFFSIPLIDSITQISSRKLIDPTMQLNSEQSIEDYRKLYAIIFAAIFCCVANAVVWNVYFSLFFTIDEINSMLIDYYDTIFYFVLSSLFINYLFLYKISHKFIIKTYSWLPFTNLLTACLITIVLFGVGASIITCFVLPFIFKSIIFLLAWLIVCYIMLYYFTRFSLWRYFA
ncbi:hypothetical protein RHO12_00220 [Orbus sturtevantii]|uniref:hypothetical protein n=1 Tax=Orbus sturtevantii TaxID=3074109 RepID=UPI00370D3097